MCLKFSFYAKYLGYLSPRSATKLPNHSSPLCLIIINRQLFTCPVPRALNEVAKLPLLSKLGPERLCFVWNKQFEPRKDVATMTLDSGNYQLFTRNNKLFPMFITPLVYKYGFEVLIWQFVDPKCALITSLETYKQKGRDSYPLLIFTAFDELLVSHRLALLRVDVLCTKITKHQASTILRNIIKFYINDSYFEWVKRFNGMGEEFDFQSFKDNYLDMFNSESEC
ncbi:ATP synthase mitochondrial F1 complex assembly factor 1 [Babesia microti strain RI]|uniref:ATP synthase mitochondrial F1 complex assembly factor 1 n=1 Tax=Babesia microti (strain RI) TaxID=1133968 RepID=A0A1R4AB31_BABMR|nr:ATP synthase mitochondrial F1 complex assembly factor 1 [Babesia microti strain RI]SJK86223.1 ATP synthase mitochondrial F1 complex assembly factor 1 [Babesia microti strain RI]|eukprot:XP_012648672.2 ATP synthase mitochondrial F1 complex assembly factor 1 [Babesia microti strain RI]